MKKAEPLRAGDKHRILAKIAPFIKIGVEACDFVAGGTQKRAHPSNDMALMTSDKNLHYDYC